jgi:hypothetical protein
MLEIKAEYVWLVSLVLGPHVKLRRRNLHIYIRLFKCTDAHNIHVHIYIYIDVP